MKKILILLSLVFIITPPSVFAAENDVILSVYQDSETTLIINAWDGIGGGFVGDLKIQIWSAENSNDDLKEYPLSFTDGKYSTQVNISDHNNNKGIYYLNLYGPAGLLKSDFATVAVSGNEWVKYVYEDGSIEKKIVRATLFTDPTIESSTEEANSDYEDNFKSGYGYTTELKTTVITNEEIDASTTIAAAGNARILFPEFNYSNGITIGETFGQYDRLTDCISREDSQNVEFSTLSFKPNLFSASENRVHFTPIWYPDEQEYLFYTDIFDAWTPAGMLGTSTTCSFTVNGNVYDDWQVNETR